MKKILLIVFTLIIGFNVYGQRQRRRDMTGIPQTNREPSKQEIAKHKRMLEDRKQEFIANFLTTLEADDFQKEIIKQHINSYFDEKVALSKVKFEHTLDRDKAIKKLDDTHFADLEELISKEDMAKIKDMITGGFDEKEVKKEKKKKKKRKKRNKDND